MASPLVQQTNLVLNPSFETNTTGWTATGSPLTSGATLTRITTAAYAGSASLQVGTNIGQGVLYSLSGTFLANTTYSFSIFIQGAVGNEHITIKFGDTTASDYAVSALNITNSFTKYDLTYTPTANRTSVVVALSATDQNSINWSIDGAIVTKNDRAIPYFDGDTLGYQWSGAAHASTSNGPLSFINLIPNPNMDSGIGTWAIGGSILGAAIVASTTWSHSGTTSLHLTASGGSDNFHSEIVIRDSGTGSNINIPVQAGQYYLFSAYKNQASAMVQGAYTFDPVGPFFLINWYDAGANLINTGGPVYSPGSNATGVSRMVFATQAPANARYVQPALGCYTSNTTGALDVYFDDVQLTVQRGVNVLDGFGHSGAQGQIADEPGNRGTGLISLNAVRLYEQEKNIALGGANITNVSNTTSGLASPAPPSWATCLQTYSAATRPPIAPYVARNDQTIIWHGLNDSGQNPSNLATMFRTCFRTVVSRFRAAAIFENTDSSIAYSSGWATTASTVNCSGAGLTSSTTPGSSFTITVPAAFAGGTIAIGFSCSDVRGALHTVTIDGSSVASIDTRTLVTQSTWWNGHVQRYTGLAAGAHTIVVTYTSGTASDFDYWQIEAPTPQEILLVQMYYPFDYTGFNGVPFSAPHTPTDGDVDILNAAIADVAAEFDSRVSLYNPHSLMDRSLTLTAPDKLHPNQAGHTALAAAIAALPWPSVVNPEQGYFDGDTSRASWTGTARNSASTLPNIFTVSTSDTAHATEVLDVQGAGVRQTADTAPAVETVLRRVYPSGVSGSTLYMRESQIGSSGLYDLNTTADSNNNSATTLSWQNTAAFQQVLPMAANNTNANPPATNAAATNKGWKIGLHDIVPAQSPDARILTAGSLTFTAMMSSLTGPTATWRIIVYKINSDGSSTELGRHDQSVTIGINVILTNAVDLSGVSLANRTFGFGESFQVEMWINPSTTAQVQIVLGSSTTANLTRIGLPTPGLFTSWVSSPTEISPNAKDAATRSSGTFARAVSDSNTTTDSVVRARLYTVTRSDTAAATDTNSFLKNSPRFISDSTFAVDLVTRQAMLFRTPSDASGGTSSVLTGGIYARPSSDASNGTDVVARQVASPRTVNDTANAAEAIARLYVALRTGTNSAGAADSLLRNMLLGRVLADASSGSDSNSRNLVVFRQPADSSTTTDLASRLLIDTRLTNDTSSAVDTLTRNIFIVRIPLDTASATDTNTRSYLGTRNPSDATSITDSSSRSDIDFRLIADSAPALDFLSWGSSRFQFLHDFAPAIDNLTRIGIGSRSISDTAGATEIGGSFVVRARTLSDSAPAIGLLSYFQILSRLSSDPAIATDLLTRHMLALRPLSESAGGTSLLNVITMRGRTGFDDAPAVESIFQIRVRLRLIDDFAPAVESIVFGTAAFRQPIIGGFTVYQSVKDPGSGSYNPYIYAEEWNS